MKKTELPDNGEEVIWQLEHVLATIESLLHAGHGVASRGLREPSSSSD